MDDDDFLLSSANRSQEASEMAQNLMEEMPGYVVRKAYTDTRTNPSNEAFLESLDQVLANENFAVFCSFFNFHALPLVHEEMGRDFDQDIMAIFMTDSQSKRVQSSMLYCKHELLSRCDAALGRMGVLENVQSRIQIKTAEDKAAYMLERYAPQTVFNYFNDNFCEVPVYSAYLEEAKNRKLPALEKILSHYFTNFEAEERLLFARLEKPNGADGPR